MPAPASIADYLRLYGSTLGEHVLARFPALHSPDDPVWPALMQLKRRPFPAPQCGRILNAQRGRFRNRASRECSSERPILSREGP